MEELTKEEQYNRELQNMQIKPKETNTEYAKPYVKLSQIYGTNEYGMREDVMPVLGYEKSALQQEEEINNNPNKYEYTPVISKSITTPHGPQQLMNNPGYDYSDDYTKKQAYINSINQDTAVYNQQYSGGYGISGRSTEAKIKNAITEPVYMKSIINNYYSRMGKDYF